MNIIFDEYQKYRNTELIINSIREKGNQFKILQVGANENNNLEKFLPSDDIKYLNTSLSEENKYDPKYILGDPCNMTFEDGEFEIIVVIDVLENMAEENRTSFIKEINRVCSMAFIISSSFDDDYIEEAEVRANLFYKELTGNNHTFLKEHIDNKLPNLSETLNRLEEMGINYARFTHGNIDIWERMMNINSQNMNGINISESIDRINEFYNKYVFEYDYSDKAYRNFIIGNKNDCVVSVERKPKPTEECMDKFNYLEKLFMHTYKFKTDKCSFENTNHNNMMIAKTYKSEVDRLVNEKEEKNIEIANLKNKCEKLESIQELYVEKCGEVSRYKEDVKEYKRTHNEILKSSSWRITAPLRGIREMFRK